MSLRAFRFLSSVMKNRAGGVPRPSWCTYVVTYRCNALCKMCDSWQMPRGEEMTPRQTGALFRDIGPLDVVRLTGGEPFLRRDLLTIAENVMRASNPLTLHVTTNGSKVEETLRFAGEFSRPKRLHVMVSFDGLEEVHDANRGPAVTFDKAIETVRGLAEIRASRKIGLSVNHTVISEESMADGDALRELFAVMNVDLQSVLAYADSALYGADRAGACADDLISDSSYPLREELRDADTVRFVEKETARCEQIQQRLLRCGKSYYWNGLRQRIAPSAGGNGTIRKPRCVALRSHVRVLPNGDAPVCQFNGEVVGNLLRDSFRDVWHGERATALRKWVDGCPGCWAECEVIPNAIYSGDIIRGYAKVKS